MLTGKVIMSTVKLRNAFSSNIEYSSVIGDGLEDKWIYYVDESGRKRRKRDGKVNVYEKIQAALPSTDINSILIRAAAGETNLLNVPNLGFIDTSALPLDENQRIDMVSKAKESFEKLSPEIKAAFGNSFGSFYKAVADGIAEKTIKEALIKTKEVVKSEVKEEPKGEE